MAKKVILPLCLPLFSFAILCTDAGAQDAQTLVEKSFNYMRGKTSTATVEMVIHRPEWERVATIKAWTRGEQDSIFWITAPPKDKGNGTLKRGREMWLYNPKVNRVIKIPPSMMSQAWMGSDFSNDDLSKTDSLLHDYSHTIIATETHEEKTVYLIQSMPKPDAPVVWGMQKLKIREDSIFLEQDFYDEDHELVKALTTSQIQLLGGRLLPRVWKMQKADVQGEYTLLKYREITFDQPLSDSLFSLSSLRRPRR